MATVDDAHISVHFKHGIHTIYLFVDALAPFSAVTHELVELLRERYPSGLTTTVAPPKRTPIAPGARLAYGVLNAPADPSKGWKRLKVGGDDEEWTPTRCDLTGNSIVAFTVLDGDDEPLFEVEWPREDEELYAQGRRDGRFDDTMSCEA